MRTRNLIFLILSLSFVLAGGLLLVGHRIVPFVNRYYFPTPSRDCGETPDARPCLIEEATGIARHIENPMTRAGMLARIIRAVETVTPLRMPGSTTPEYIVYPAAPSHDEAVDAAAAIEPIERRIMAMVPVAALLTEAGHERGPRLFESLVRLVREEGSADPLSAMRLGPESAKSETLLRIARAQATAGDPGGARRTAAAQGTGLWRVKTLAAVAEALATRGDPALAPGFADEAAKLLNSLPDPEAAAEAAAEVAGVLARAGRIADALALAARPTDIVTRAFAHANVVKALADAGRLAEAEDAFGRIEHFSARYQALWWLARARAAAGDVAGAKAQLQDIKMPLLRHQAVGDIAGFQAAAGDLQGALDDIADLPEGFARDRALGIVLESLIDSGRLAEAEDILAGLADDALRRGLTVKMAAARAQAGRLDAALALARAAQDPSTRIEALLAVAEGMPGPD